MGGSLGPAHAVPSDFPNKIVIRLSQTKMSVISSLIKNSAKTSLLIILKFLILIVSSFHLFS